MYVGLTKDIKERIVRHNTGREKTTRFYKPFVLIYSEICESRIEARKREKYWKSVVGKEKLRRIRNNYQNE